MAVVVGDFVRLTAKMKLFGTDDVMNVFLYRMDRVDSADDLDLMEDAAVFLDVAYTNIDNEITDDLTFVTIDGFNVSKSELLPEVPWPVLTTGANVTTLLPTQCAAEVFWPTTTPKVRTTTFLGGYCISSITAGGVLDGPPLGRLADFAAALTEWNTVDIDAVKGSFNETKLLFTQSGAPVVPNRFRTQRRRRIGVGS